MRRKEVYTFTKGQQFTLDQIYTIQGLGGGDWWEKADDDMSAFERDMSESLICTRSIKITIIIEIELIEGE